MVEAGVGHRAQTSRRVSGWASGGPNARVWVVYGQIAGILAVTRCRPVHPARRAVEPGGSSDLAEQQPVP